MANEETVYTNRFASQDLINEAQKLDAAVAMIEQIRGGSAYRAPMAQLKEMLDALLRDVPIVGHKLVAPAKMYRGRIDNVETVLRKPEEFRYKPVKFSKDLGRIIGLARPFSTAQRTSTPSCRSCYLR